MSETIIILLLVACIISRFIIIQQTNILENLEDVKKTNLSIISYLLVIESKLDSN